MGNPRIKIRPYDADDAIEANILKIVDHFNSSFDSFVSLEIEYDDNRSHASYFESYGIIVSFGNVHSAVRINAQDLDMHHASDIMSHIFKTLATELGLMIVLKDHS